MTASNPTWSNTDFPYMCLKDQRRTEAFRDAISLAVKPGDVVVEMGAGSGILSLFAAAAGASRVIAVEIDRMLVEALHRTVSANGFDSIIEVRHGDALAVDLPRNVDVVITEMIDTGLIDELQVPVMNRLHETGVISCATTLLPRSYETRMQLVSCSLDYYGMTVYSPKHLWPFFSGDPSWHETQVTAVSEPVVVASDDFSAGQRDLQIDEVITFPIHANLRANAIRILGSAVLGDSVIDATNALNGDKVIPLPPLVDEGLFGSSVQLRIRFKRGGGLVSLGVTLP